MKGSKALTILIAAALLSACASFDEGMNGSAPDYSAVRKAAEASVSVPDTEQKSGVPANSWSAEYFLAAQNDMIKAAYRALYEGIFTYKTEIELPDGAVTQDSFGALLSLVNSTGLCGDSIDADYKMYLNSKGYVVKVAVGYVRTPEEGAAQYAILTSEAERIAATAAALPDDYERVKFFHDELVRSCEYSSDGADSRCAYGALYSRKAVCEGYAKAFMLLCELSDIPCLPVGGNAVDKEGVRQLHMWNKVQLDGRWYNIDCTWDDPMGVEKGSVRYDYFLVGDKDLMATHTEDKGGLMKLPAADDNEGSYFHREGRLLSRSDNIEERFREECGRIIEGSALDDTIRFKCEDKGVYAEVMAALFDVDSDGEKGMVDLLRDYLTDDRGLSYVLTTDENMRTINLQIIVTDEAAEEAVG